MRATGIADLLEASGGWSGMNESTANPWTAEFGDDGIVLVK